MHCNLSTQSHLSAGRLPLFVFPSILIIYLYLYSWQICVCIKFVCIWCKLVFVYLELDFLWPAFYETSVGSSYWLPDKAEVHNVCSKMQPKTIIKFDPQEARIQCRLLLWFGCGGRSPHPIIWSLHTSTPPICLVLQVKTYLHCCRLSSTIVENRRVSGKPSPTNKFASLKATLVRKYDPVSEWVIVVKCSYNWWIFRNVLNCRWLSDFVVCGWIKSSCMS